MVDTVYGGNAFSTFEEDQPGFVGAYSPSSRLVSEVMLSVRRQFGDDAGVQVEDADLIRWINDAQDEVANRNRFLKAISTVAAEPGIASYRWPTENILQVESVHYDGKQIPNLPFATAEIRIGDSPTLEGCPRLWYEWAGQFTFWPVPNESKEIKLYLTLRPAKVTSGTDVLSVPDKYFTDIVRYVLMQAYEMDEDWQAVQAKQQQFDASITGLGEEERTAQNMTYEVINIVEDC